MTIKSTRPLALADHALRGFEVKSPPGWAPSAERTAAGDWSLMLPEVRPGVISWTSVTLRGPQAKRIAEAICDAIRAGAVTGG